MVAVSLVVVGPFYVNIVRPQFLVSACFIKPDGCYCLVQFSLDVSV